MHDTHGVRIELLIVIALTLFAGAPGSVLSAEATPVFTQDSAPPTLELADLPKRKQVSQYGITWTFAQEVPVGRFVTGDWYVVGPVTVVMIDPKPLFGDEVAKQWPDEIWPYEGKRINGQFARNGSTLNQPMNNLAAGYDSRCKDRRYDPKQFTPLPITMKPGDSLISTASMRDAEFFEQALFQGYGSASSSKITEKKGRKPWELSGHNHGKPVKTAAVLTCMAGPQPADAFRPSYADRENKVYLARSLRRELLYSLPKPVSTPSLAKWTRQFERPWIDVVEYHYAAVRQNMPGYGPYTTEAVSTVGLMLHLDFEPEEKEKLLIGFVQYGIDLWGMMRAGYKGWMGHGGFGDGRKWPIIFAGLMFGDEDMASPNSKYPKVVFGEDTKTAFAKGWTGADVVFLSHPRNGPTATTSPELQHPSKWQKAQSEAYRRCCTSSHYPGQALAARLMRAERYWNHDAFFAYVDRWTTEDLREVALKMKEADKKGWFQDWWLLQTIWDRNETALQKDMWEKYRNNLPLAKTAM